MELPKLFFVTQNTPIEKLQEVAHCKIAGIQIREKELEGKAFYEYALKAKAQQQFLSINERLDIALAVDADGVHLKEKGLPIKIVKKLAPNLRVGKSVHSLQMAILAESEGADYLFFGPVYDTPLKKDFGSPQGIAKLKEVTSAVFIPIYAIGGIDISNAAQCIEAGAYGIACISAITKSENVLKTLQSLKDCCDSIYC